jgi:hypothetical protein
MKIHGQRPEPPKAKPVVIPRESGDLVFQCSPVFDFTKFEQLCPTPKAPLITRAGGEKLPDLDDPTYNKKLMERGNQRMAWMLIQSLKDTPGLEWEKVKLNKPDTYEKVFDELKEANLSQMEINYLVKTVLEVSSMDEERLEEARRNFIRIQQAEIAP